MVGHAFAAPAQQIIPDFLEIISGLGG